MQPTLSLIAAIASHDRAIGKDNALLWHIPEDLRRFKSLTSGHAIIMGENTFRSIGRPLPNRTNIVLSLDPNFQPVGCVVASSIESALEEAKRVEKEEIFVIGGASIYRQFLPLADRLYLTLVEGRYEADTYFPEYPEFTVEKERQANDNGVDRFTFLILERS